MRTVLLVAVLVVLLGIYVSWTAGRLDRLHARVDAAWAALDAALARRAAAARAVVPHLPEGPEARALEQAARASLVGGPVAREAVENDLSGALRAALSLLPPEAHAAPAMTELDTATSRVGLARSWHNTAVSDARTVRRRRVPRALRLAGHRVLPAYFDIDDTLLR